MSEDELNAVLTLAHYDVVELVDHWQCRRCWAMGAPADDGGEHTTTLADVVLSALDHEREAHR